MFLCSGVPAEPPAQRPAGRREGPVQRGETLGGSENPDCPETQAEGSQTPGDVYLFVFLPNFPQLWKEPTAVPAAKIKTPKALISVFDVSCYKTSHACFLLLSLFY